MHLDFPPEFVYVAFTKITNVHSMDETNEN